MYSVMFHKDSFIKTSSTLTHIQGFVMDVFIMTSLELTYTRFLKVLFIKQAQTLHIQGFVMAFPNSKRKKANPTNVPWTRTRSRNMY